MATAPSYVDTTGSRTHLNRPIGGSNLNIPGSCSAVYSATEVIKHHIAGTRRKVYIIPCRYLDTCLELHAIPRPPPEHAPIVITRADMNVVPSLIESVLMPLRSEEHTSELQSRGHLVCRLLLEKKNT